jgi:hypothetical protein
MALLQALQHQRRRHPNRILGRLDSGLGTQIRAWGPHRREGGRFGVRARAFYGRMGETALLF